jgi:3-hydroxyisobutyrate dehydrogenase-like beta-hydroxyacid dehydrogenase
VSGSKKPAEEGSLIILAGGDKDLVDDLTPLFLSMGKKVVHCGPEGSGSMMKMTANLLLGMMMEGLCEALNFGEKGGLDKAAILDALLSGPMGCGLFKMKEEMLKSGDYPAQFPLKHMLKDIKFVSDTAFETGAATPGAHAVLLLYRQAMAHGFGDLDFSAVMKALQEAS